ncbi:MAG: hypothetical protein EU536_00115 [Promethearchaeota archaeon]|nr:MAG: hypothetical protein EU536_00115 [Candidatus Lokiarchaeota archaeon]
MTHIEGIFREPALVLEAIIILICLEVGGFFLFKFLKTEEKGRNFMILAWGIFFLAYSGMAVFFIVGDYYSDAIVRPFNVNVGYTIMAFGALIFTYNAERELNQRKHVLFLALLGLILVMLIDFVVGFIEPYYIAILAWIPFILILLIYLIRAFSKIKEYRGRIYGCLIGFLVFGIGFAVTIDLMIESFGAISRFVGNIGIIGGISIASWQFIGLPALKEMDWSKKLNKLLLMHSSGTCICEYNFGGDTVHKEISETPHLVAGSLIGITKMITEIIQSSKQLKIMDHQDKKVLFAYGKNLIAALIVDDYLEIYRKKLNILLEELEIIYKDSLEDWDGSLSQFNLVEKFINRIFVSTRK